MTRVLLEEFRLRRQSLALAVALAVAGPWAAEALLGVLGPLPRSPFGALLARGLSHPAFADLLALALAALALHTAADAFPAQRDRGTDAFFAGLPLAPRRVFAARAMTCAAVVLLVPLLRHPLYLLWHLAAGDWPPGFFSEVAAPLFLGDLLRAVVFAGLALTLAHGRRLGWLLGAALFLGLRAGVTYELLPPGCDLLRFAGPSADPAARPTLAAAGAWLALAGGATTLGYALFVTRDDALARIDVALRRGALVPTLANGVSLLALAAAPLSVVADAVHIGPTTASYPATQVTARTAQFRFEFATRNSGRARRLIADADLIHERVSAILGATTPEGRMLDVVLTDADLAPVGPDDPPEIELDRAPRLALARLSCERLLRDRLGDRLVRWRRATHTFEEGLCRNVAWRATEEDPFGSRFEAAVHHCRRPFGLDQVFDRRELRMRGEEVGPVLGEVFVEAIVRERGRAAIPALLKIFADLPARRVSGADETIALWREVLAKAGLGIEPLEERMLSVLEDEILNDPRSRIALPRMRVILQIQEKPIGWRVLAVPDQDVPPGWYVACRVRREPPGEREDDPPRPQRLGPDPTGCHAFFLRSSPFRGPPWVQVGLSPVDPRPLLGTLWEEWKSPDGRP